MNKTSRFLTDTIGFDDKIHASQSDLNLVNLALDMNSKNSWPDIHVDETDRNNVTSFLRQNGMKENKFVCVCPDASSEKKQWSLNNYSAVIAHISRKYPNHKIVLVGADQNKMLALTLFCQTADIVWFTNHNLREVYLLMQKSSVVIAQDGGPMHLAWAGNSKLVALIPDYLSLKHIGPLGKNSHIIYKPMKDISIKEVTKKIDEVLNGEK
jgi:ADP-heptose:LPS heptosyltransferase